MKLLPDPCKSCSHTYIGEKRRTFGRRIERERERERERGGGERERG